MNSFTVTKLNNTLKYLIESADFLQNISVSGEVSNLTKHSSGHYYFTLKDNESQISCVMFRNVAMKLGFNLKEGNQVLAKCNVNVYVPRGNYQINITSLQLAGIGNVYQQFIDLKNKLHKEGLFDLEHKKNLPFVAQNIGVVTSPTGAVIQDIIKTINRRFPCVNIILSPSKVQGEDAPKTLVAGLKLLTRQANVDAIIIGRGGGSMEDLSCFNDEELARTIFDINIPIVAAIGHETDFTIADFVADVRAATPTAAAELLVPDLEDLKYDLSETQSGISRIINYQINTNYQVLDEYSDRISHVIKSNLQEKKHLLDLLKSKLEMANVKEVLKRGFSLTYSNGKKLTNSKSIKKGDKIQTILADGEIQSEVVV